MAALAVLLLAVHAGFFAGHDELLGDGGELGALKPALATEKASFFLRADIRARQESN